MHDNRNKTLIDTFDIELRLSDSHYWFKWDAKVTSNTYGNSEYCRGFHHGKTAALKCGRRKARKLAKEAKIGTVKDTPNNITYEVYK